MLLLALVACESFHADPIDTGRGRPPRPDTGEDSGDTGDSGAGPSLPLVPWPQSVTATGGTWTIDATVSVGAAGLAAREGDALAERLRASTGFAVPIGETGTIQLELGGDEPPEGYTLDVTAEGVTVTASDPAGLFYGVQTLLQLAPAAVYGATPAADVVWTVPTVHVEDAPRFGWRGVMIDVARHFFSVADIERQVDVMAAHKLNRLHLHLSDDQGWRIEILSWPRLAEVGGATEVGGGPGGYYTQADLEAIIAYAEARHVTVIPEVDFPGHANAALSAYAELNESGVAAEPYTGTPVLSTPLWLDGPDTRPFVADVWRELAALAPDTVVHIGGDEAVGLSAVDYADFVEWLEHDVAGEGSRVVGWDEIGGAQLSAPFYVQYWYDLESARDAVAQGGRMIASPATHTYFDMKQSSDAEYGQVWAGIVTTRTAYVWDPVGNGLTEETVAGVEACLWTEFIDDNAKMDFMLWPRAAATAEVGWTTDRVWSDFQGRLAYDGARLTVMGVGYAPDPDIDWVAP